jgi:DNA-binding transcriptional ArsR family regulator
MSKAKPILLNWEKVQRAADILKTVAHPTRLRIAELLQTGEMTVGEIQEAPGRPSPDLATTLPDEGQRNPQISESGKIRLLWCRQP